MEASSARRAEGTVVKDRREVTSLTIRCTRMFARMYSVRNSYTRYVLADVTSKSPSWAPLEADGRKRTTTVLVDCCADTHMHQSKASKVSRISKRIKTTACLEKDGEYLTMIV